MFADISDIQYALDMTDGAGEILGYFQISYTRDNRKRDSLNFNARYQNLDDQFAYKMLTLRDQNGLGSLSRYGEYLDFLYLSGGLSS